MSSLILKRELHTLSYLVNMGRHLFFFKNLPHLHMKNSAPTLFVFNKLGLSRYEIFTNPYLNQFSNDNNSEKLNSNRYLCLFEAFQFSISFSFFQPSRLLGSWEYGNEISLEINKILRDTLLTKNNWTIFIFKSFSTLHCAQTAQCGVANQFSQDL